MKLSFSLALLAAAAVSVQAASTPIRASSTCISGSSGKGKGDGYYGYCCKTSNDCRESCKSGVCNGPALSTDTGTPPPLSTETTGVCLPGVKGKRNGDGYLGYCCSSSDDCVESCKSGVCNGPALSTTTGTPPPLSTETTGVCLPGVKGKRKGDGYLGYCCSSSDDCVESCKSGVCNGPALSTTTGTPPPLSTETISVCLPGVKGKRNGDGYLGYCCSSSDDCVESCKSGMCNGSLKPNDPPAGSACRAGYAGLKNGQGPASACCWDSDDCQESCVNGRCN